MHKRIRESNFELLRIIAILMIVLYHLFYQSVYGTTQIPIYRALWLPLHIGVILFILISGFFKIKTTLSGLFNLLIKILIIVVPLHFIAIYQQSNSIINAFSSLLLISHSPLWYVRVYICLYLIAPIINAFLRSATEKQRIIALIGLGYISCIYGTISLDRFLVDSEGKNLINFILIYMLGDTLKYYKNKLSTIPTTFLIAFYFILNIILTSLYLFFFNESAGKIIYRLGYSYNSPIVIFNAILLFLIFSRWKFQSRIVNHIAQSVFTVYLLQESPLILWSYIVPCLEKLMATSHSPSFLLPHLIIFTFIILIISVCIDKLLNPVWWIGQNISIKLEYKLNKLWNK